MKIIILGANQIGCSLAETLTNESNDITIVDPDNEKLRELKDQIDEVITNRRYRKVLESTNTKAVTTAWVVVAVLISLYRYLTM